MEKIPNIFITTLLLTISVVLVSIMSLLTWLVFTLICLLSGKIKKLSAYYYNCAISGDQTGNTFCAPFLNLTFKKKGGYEFGNIDETVSSAMGKNAELNKLSRFGKFIGIILNKLDPNHLGKSIEINP